MLLAIWKHVGNRLRVLQVEHQRKGILRIHQRVWKFFQSRKASNVVTGFGTVALLGVTVFGYSQSAALGRTHAQPSSPCSPCTAYQVGDTGTVYQVSDDTGIHHQAALQWKPRHSAAGKVAIHVAPLRSQLVQSEGVHNGPTQGTPTTTTSPTQGTPTTTAPPTGTTGGGNVFPYGSCTWWADQRYFRLHGVFVPWHTQANAWEWTARAYEFGWHVSGKPVVGAIIDLQPGVQGASGLGHVAVVEKILSNGHVIASNMSWGAYPWQVTNVEFTPGPGVTFIFR
ncbi:MAG: CHAP domain-containing protein [Chloroflexi bacterium]|nr:MAG: CHAP domain-containing protein [Chloroflexota bacterium]